MDKRKIFQILKEFHVFIRTLGKIKMTALHNASRFGNTNLKEVGKSRIKIKRSSVLFCFVFELDSWPMFKKEKNIAL